MRIAALMLAAVLALGAGAPAASAARASLPDIEDEVMCPVCGTPLNVANESPQAERERAFIRALIGQGRTKEQIKRALVAEFGSGVLALPEEDQGVNWAAYVVPVAVLAAVAALLALTVPGWRRRRAGPLEDGGGDVRPEVSAADRARLDEELARYD